VDRFTMRREPQERTQRRQPRQRARRNILCLLCFLCLLCGSRRAEAQTVQILDTLYNADGTTASGRIVISWDPFTAADMTTVDGGTLTYTIPATGINAGVVNVPLYANVGATPAGTSYAARYFLANGAQYTETWIVPSFGPATIADVRVLNAPAPGAAIPISALTGGPLPLPLGGTGLDAVGGANLCLKVNSAGTALEYGSCATGGTGITSLNGQTGTSQTFAAGTSGSNFNISSSSDVHTFNLPSASGTNRGALTSADWTTFNNSVDAVSGTASEISSSGGQAPAISLATQLNLSGKEIIGGASPLRFEGATDDNTYTTVTVTDPTAARTFTLPNANSVAVQPDAGAANNFLTAISALGVISKAQPAFSNLSGAATAGQVPNLESLNGTLDVPSGGTGAAPGAGDQALVSDSTSAATWRAIPDCNTEQMLTYTASSNTFGCEADDGGGGGMTSFNIDGDNNGPQTITNGNEALFVGGIGITTTAAATDQVTIATASGETDFLASGALTCGASTQGRMQVHTTPLQYCDNAGTPTLRYASYGTSSGESSAAANDSVALTTDTTGNYVASITNGNGITGGNGGSEGAALTLAVDWAATKTLTNTTLDAEGTGNAITKRSFILPTVAMCDEGTAFRGGNSDATGATAPTAACNDTGSIQVPSLDYSGSAVNSREWKFVLPVGWTGNIDLDLWYASVAASPTGNVEWDISTVCRAAGESWDGSFNAAQTITDAVAAQNFRNIATQAALTTTGCAASEILTIKVSRDGTNDTNDDLAKLTEMQVTLRWTD